MFSRLPGISIIYICLYYQKIKRYPQEKSPPRKNISDLSKKKKDHICLTRLHLSMWHGKKIRTHRNLHSMICDFHFLFASGRVSPKPIEQATSTVASTFILPVAYLRNHPASLPGFRQPLRSDELRSACHKLNAKIGCEVKRA